MITEQQPKAVLDREILALGAVVVLGTIMSILDVTIVNVAIPTLGQDFDASISKDFHFGEDSTANVFFNVRNLLDRDPAVAAAFGSFADTLSPANANLYDVLGRVLNAGVKIEF